MITLITSALDVSRYVVGAIAAVVLLIVLGLVACAVRAAWDVVRERRRAR